MSHLHQSPGERGGRVPFMLTLSYSLLAKGWELENARKTPENAAFFNKPGGIGRRGITIALLVQAVRIFLQVSRGLPGLATIPAPKN